MRRLESNDSVEPFSCGNDEWDKDIADFLKEDAFLEQEKGLNATWLCLKENEIVGYTSLIASTLSIEKAPAWKIILNIGEIERDYIPCILIGQFGVATDHQRQGVGSFMLSFIRGAALDSEFGIKLLTLHVHTDNTAGRKFWESKDLRIYPPKSGSKYKFMVHDLFGR